MGIKSNPTLEYVQHFYLDQFLKGAYEEILCDSTSVQQPSLLLTLFIVHEQYDYVEETYKTILYQWLEQKNDLRYKFYAKKILMPTNKLDLSVFTSNEIYSFITPQNENNV